MPDLGWEDRLRTEGFTCIAGIDEAGRGPLAGPVVAAAVVLPAGFAHATLNDSKKVSPKKREALYGEITQDPAIFWCSAQASTEEIDRLNILYASHLAMQRALEGLTREADVALIDGLEVKGFPIPQRALVKGDSISLSIAAASIIAKVERDRLMTDLAAKYPAYGFEQHKGYPTAHHLKQLQHHGPCPIHRQSFGPVAQLTLPFGEAKRVAP